MGLSVGILGEKSVDYVHPNDFRSSFVDIVRELVLLKVKFCPDIASQLCVKLFPLEPEAVFLYGFSWMKR